MSLISLAREYLEPLPGPAEPLCADMKGYPNYIPEGLEDITNPRVLLRLHRAHTWPGEHTRLVEVRICEVANNVIELGLLALLRDVMLEKVCIQKMEYRIYEVAKDVTDLDLLTKLDVENWSVVCCKIQLIDHIVLIVDSITDKSRSSWFEGVLKHDIVPPDFLFEKIKQKAKELRDA